MSEDIKLSQVEILIKLDRLSEAEKILKNLLSQDANNTFVLSLFAEVKIKQDNYEQANTIINNAIAVAPDFSHLYYVKSRIAIHQDNLNEAENNIRHAIGLNPQDADYLALFAQIKLLQKQPKEALKLADKALQTEPENLLGLNIRSTALLKLNESEKSFNTIEGALREAPNNAYTHANYGWGLLEKGNHKKALKHFKESLKNDPNHSYAQMGMLEAIKASNPLYRLFLKYSFWMGNLTSKYQWGVIIGFYIGYRILNAIAKNNEALQPYLYPLLIALAIFAFSTWVMDPIANLFLRFNTYGQLLLDKKQKMSSNFVAISMAVLLLGVLFYFILNDDRFLVVIGFGFTMMLPYSTMFMPTKYKNSLLVYAIVMTFIGILAIGITFTTGSLFNMMTVIFLVGFIAFQWVANFLLIKEDNP